MSYSYAKDEFCSPTPGIRRSARIAKKGPIPNPPGTYYDERILRQMEDTADAILKVWDPIDQMFYSRCINMWVNKCYRMLTDIAPYMDSIVNIVSRPKTPRRWKAIMHRLHYAVGLVKNAAIVDLSVLQNKLFYDVVNQILQKTDPHGLR